MTKLRVRASKKQSPWLAFVWPDYHIYQAISVMLAWFKDFARVSAPLSKLAVVYKDNTTIFNVLKSEYERQGYVFFQKVLLKPKLMFSVLEQVNKTADEIFALCKKLEKIDFSQTTNSELLNIYRRLFKIDSKLWRGGQIQNLLELHNSYLSSHVNELVIKKLGRNLEIEAMKSLTSPTYFSMSEQQNKDFLKLLKIIPQDINQSNSLIKKHWQKYCWINYGWSGPAFDVDYFYKNILTARKNSKLLRELERKLLQSQVILKQQKLLLKHFTQSEKKLIILLRELVNSKLKRVDAHSYTYFIAERMMSEIGRRVGLTLAQMRVVPPAKVPELFKKVNLNIINQELKCVVYFCYKGKITKLTGGAAELKIRLLSAPKKQSNQKVNSLSGELAYPGKLTGQARVILSGSDINKFKKGEILVSRMTDPSFVPIMKLAKAIITDIGGITSHAAIVSRELRVPCLVGTEIATKVIKNGDQVEVNANKGIVKIIKRA